MGRWLGGVFGNTKLATDNQDQTTGRYTISDHYYMRQEGGWTPPPGTSDNPASSAKELYDAGIRTNGTYYLKHGNNAAYQAYCWLDAQSGGGYILAGKIDNSNPSAWRWNGGNWNSSSDVNAANCQNLNNNSGLNQAWYQYTLQTGFRMGLHSSVPTVVSNYLSESKTGNTCRYFFTNSSSSQNGRSDFKSWLSGAGLDNGFNSAYDQGQQNCNQTGFNQSSSSHNVRWGTSGNNENNCDSNDSVIGFGGTASGCNMAAGGEITHPSNLDRFGIGYIFVQ